MSTFLETSNVFVKKLLDLDNEMKSKISEKDNSIEDINQIYLDRLSLYEKSSILPMNENDKLFLQNRKEDVYLEFKMFKYKRDLHRQMDDIETSLEDLKNSM